MRIVPPHRLRVLAAGVTPQIRPADAEGRTVLLGAAPGAEDVAPLAESLDADVVLVEQTMVPLAAELDGCGVVIVREDSVLAGSAAAEAAEPDWRLPHELLDVVAVLGWLGAVGGPTLAPYSPN